jgi:hypothetical protein
MIWAMACKEMEPEDRDPGLLQICCTSGPSGSDEVTPSVKLVLVKTGRHSVRGVSVSRSSNTMQWPNQKRALK